jgi:hypothetical protein
LLGILKDLDSANNIEWNVISVPLNLDSDIFDESWCEDFLFVTPLRVLVVAAAVAALLPPRLCLLELRAVGIAFEE